MRTARLAVVFTALFTSGAFAADLFLGTWTEDLAKSHDNWSKTKPAGSRTRTYTARPDGGYDIKVTGFDEQGKPSSNTLVAGTNQDQLLTKPTAISKKMGATHVISKRLDDHTLEATYMKDGKAVGTSTSKVSADGSTLTMTLKGTGTEGQSLSSVSVYKK